MAVDIEEVISAKAEETRAKFRGLLDKTNKENPLPKDVKALADILSDNRKLELWRDIASAGYLAELMVIENARATAAVKECWRNRLQVLKKDLGSEGAPLLEQLLIQQAALCWLKLSLITSVFKCDEAIHYVDARRVLGKAIERSSETIHKGLRDSYSCQKIIAQHACAPGQHRH